MLRLWRWCPARSQLHLRCQALPGRLRQYSGITQTVTLPHIPELYNPEFLDILLPPPLLKSELELPTASAKTYLDKTLTENLAKAYANTGNVLFDVFHKLQDGSKTKELKELLDHAWKADPERTLRIIFYLRSIHDGKSNKKLFYRAWGWLYENHPRTAIHNLKHLVEPLCPRGKILKDGRKLPGRQHGCWKDLLNILCLTLRNRDLANGHWNYGVGTIVSQNEQPHIQDSRAAFANARHRTLSKKLTEDSKFKALYIAVARLFADRMAQDLKNLQKRSEKPKRKTSESGYENDPFEWEVSLAGKWAPTPGQSHDRFTNISTAIATLLHAERDDHPWEYPSVLNSFDHTAEMTKGESDIIRSYFRRWYLSPLREFHRVPERYMSTNQWSDIQYDRVPAVCMQNNSQRFFMKDYARFSEFMFDVYKRKKSIAGATLMPHEILKRLIEFDSKMLKVGGRKSTGEEPPAAVKEIQSMKKEFYQNQIDVATAQWESIVNRVRESGTIDNSIAICDVSGSMGGLGEYEDKKNFHPIFASLAMSLLLAAVSKPPFNGGFITFSETPQFIKLDDQRSIAQKMRYMVRTDWNMNTNLQEVFTGLLLPLAKQHNVKQEDMIKRLFIFSDMQFDEAGTHSNSRWDTNYDMIKKEFEEAGYEMPEIVYWDLGSYSTVEAHADRKGVAMLKGFSAAMMKVFLGENESEPVEQHTEDGKVAEKKPEENITPMAIMNKALQRPSFDGLEILD